MSDVITQKSPNNDLLISFNVDFIFDIFKISVKILFESVPSYLYIYV